MADNIQATSSNRSGAAPSPNAMNAIQSQEARVGTPSGLEPGQGYTLGKAPGRGDDPIKANLGILISFLIHALGLIILGMSALLAPKRPSVVPVFELVNLEKPKLRPLVPKAPPPPEPPPPEPEPIKPPDAPKLTPKPEKAVVPKKPEPKIVKEQPPEPDAKVKEVAPEQQVLPQVVAHVPSDPRLSLWAARVKKKAETLWNPPTGIDILGSVKAVVNLRITRDGTITTSNLSTASGNPQLDDLAVQAVKRMERVPPIPENFPEDEIEVSIEFPYYGQ